MIHKLKTGPAIEPVTLSEMRAHMGIAQVDDTARDDVILSRIEAARQWVEGYTNQVFINQTFVAYGGGFVNDAHFGSVTVNLKGPLQSVTSIKYLSGNVLNTLDVSNYYISLPFNAVAPAHGKTWPITDGQLDAVQIEYVAGYGADAAAVPQGIKEAIMFIVSQWEVFQSSIEGIIRPMTVPNAAKELLGQYIDYRGGI